MREPRSDSPALAGWSPEPFNRRIPMTGSWPHRIRWIASHFEGGSLRALGLRIGVTRQAVSAWTRGEARPASQALSALAEAYPRLDCRWLLTGKGDPLSDGEPGEDAPY